MLELRNIVKKYVTGDTTVTALNGVSLKFRENEFVSILGASGCGKTTLLNIIGGLDRYTDGDLIINGVSTKEYKASDWDTYRNHSIGFVFQSYNLIPHQTVLANVELALTLSGVPRAERRRRAIEALEKVGLGDQLRKKPNQMSGGQMQRVAIARALVNNPDILLADEPTGALDTQTSIQIMDLIREVSRDRLVIMVTHNPELAEKYSTRIVRLQDGNIVSDSDPVGEDEILPKTPADTAKKAKQKKKDKTSGKKAKTSMSFLTALSLSKNNLMTKKGRTMLTSFAGSIGIIGIALILSLSHGIQGYIDQVQEDTLSTYPLTISRETQDYTAMMTAMTQVKKAEDHSDSGKIFVDDSIDTMMTAMNARITNNLEKFKQYLDEHESELDGYLTGIQYTYDMELQIYSQDGKTQVNPTTVFENMGERYSAMAELMKSSGMNSGMNIFDEMIDNPALLEQQYDVIAGQWPQAADEVVLVVDQNNQISKMALYMLGVLDQSELAEMMKALEEGREYEATEIAPYDFDYFLNMKFRLLSSAEYYAKAEGKTYTADGKEYPVWQDLRKLAGYDQESFVSERGTELKVVGIIRPAEGVAATSLNGSVGYTKALTDKLLAESGDWEIIRQQKETPKYDVLTGSTFEKVEWTRELLAMALSGIDEQERPMLLALLNQGLSTPVSDANDVMNMSDADFRRAINNLSSFMPQSESSYKKNLTLFGDASAASPDSINFYAKDFAAKDKIEEFIKAYNDEVSEADKMQYTDLVGIMMSSITTIINVISYVLIAFVSISLVVSSIMIGIITYISVLERTKEIGILRSIGASKRDISRVFNAETLIVGLAAGLIGILTTVLFCLPINALIRALSGISGVRASLPWVAGLVLVLISMLLTVVAGLIPAKLASKKDPVEALRSE